MPGYDRNRNTMSTFPETSSISTALFCLIILMKCYPSKSSECSGDFVDIRLNIKVLFCYRPVHAFWKRHYPRADARTNSSSDPLDLFVDVLKPVTMDGESCVEQKSTVVENKWLHCACLNAIQR